MEKVRERERDRDRERERQTKEWATQDRYENVNIIILILRSPILKKNRIDN